ncbi:hypothetical protein [Pseudomonas sp. Pseu.R1]|uniref:hypothetical protein n=1 Tax=Pseudomonas sp. Pseu.R1 TaxID=3379818 RepID=UPI003B94CF0F
MSVDFILKLATVLTAFLLIVGVAALIWAAIYRLDQVEQALANSKLNTDAKRQWRNAGLVGRQYRLAMATSAVLFTKLYAKHGLVDPDDVKRMPKSLKCWIVIPNVGGAFILLAAFILGVVTDKIDLSL